RSSRSPSPTPPERWIIPSRPEPSHSLRVTFPQLATGRSEPVRSSAQAIRREVTTHRRRTIVTRVRLLSEGPDPARLTAVCAACVVVLIMTTAMFLRAAPHPGVQPAYATLPLSFEENRGQAPGDVRYLSRTGSGIVSLRSGGFSLEVDGGHDISVRFVAAGSTTPTGEQKLIGTTSYLIGDEENWVRDVPNYASVRYASVYPGIDAVFHGNREHLEYDFVLRPGADPARIRMAFEGADRIAVDAEGNLELRTPRGTLKQL